MPLLPAYPLYPNNSFTEYNVSLGIPGIHLYDIPTVGQYAKQNNYPNSQYSLLFPDIKYIEQFASYNMGISQMFLSSSQTSNENIIKNSYNNNPNILNQFMDVFSYSSQNGMGMSSLEQTILSSIFETQKPYFEIVELAIDCLIEVEDIIARYSPIFGLAVNPLAGLSIKSRKPVGNSGSFGTPVAIGYKNGQSILSIVDQLKTTSQKGNNVSISSNGTVSVTPPLTSTFSVSNNYTDGNYTYVTISTVYSTGLYENFVNYTYQYIDLPPKQILSPITTTPSVPESVSRLQTLPEIIILGLFNSKGQPINPIDPLQYQTLDSFNNTVTENSGFQIAPWITQTDKWILNNLITDSTGTSSYIWPILTAELYEWKNGSNIVSSSTSPGSGWIQLTYGDVIDFSQPANQYLTFERNNYIVNFTFQVGIYSWR